MTQQETAEILALNMLTWMAGNEEAMNSFSLQSSMAIQDIVDHIGNPPVLAELLTGVMDFMLGHEELLTQFCEDNDMNLKETVHF